MPQQIIPIHPSFIQTPKWIDAVLNPERQREIQERRKFEPFERIKKVKEGMVSIFKKIQGNDSFEVLLDSEGISGVDRGSDFDNSLIFCGETNTVFSFTEPIKTNGILEEIENVKLKFKQHLSSLKRNVLWPNIASYMPAPFLNIDLYVPIFAENEQKWSLRTIRFDVSSKANSEEIDVKQFSFELVDEFKDSDIDECVLTTLEEKVITSSLKPIELHSSDVFTIPRKTHKIYDFNSFSLQTPFTIEDFFNVSKQTANLQNAFLTRGFYSLGISGIETETSFDPLYLSLSEEVFKQYLFTPLLSTKICKYLSTIAPLYLKQNFYEGIVSLLKDTFYKSGLMGKRMILKRLLQLDNPVFNAFFTQLQRSSICLKKKIVWAEDALTNVERSDIKRTVRCLNFDSWIIGTHKPEEIILTSLEYFPSALTLSSMEDGFLTRIVGRNLERDIRFFRRLKESSIFPLELYKEGEKGILSESLNIFKLSEKKYRFFDEFGRIVTIEKNFFGGYSEFIRDRNGKIISKVRFNNDGSARTKKSGGEIQNEIVDLLARFAIIKKEQELLKTAVEYEQEFKEELGLKLKEEFDVLYEHLRNKIHLSDFQISIGTQLASTIDECDLQKKDRKNSKYVDINTEKARAEFLMKKLVVCENGRVIETEDVKSFLCSKQGVKDWISRAGQAERYLSNLENSCSIGAKMIQQDEIERLRIVCECFLEEQAINERKRKQKGLIIDEFISSQIICASHAEIEKNDVRKISNRTLIENPNRMIESYLQDFLDTIRTVETFAISQCDIQTIHEEQEEIETQKRMEFELLQREEDARQEKVLQKREEEEDEIKEEELVRQEEQEQVELNQFLKRRAEEDTRNKEKLNQKHLKMLQTREREEAQNNERTGLILQTREREDAEDLDDLQKQERLLRRGEEDEQILQRWEQILRRWEAEDISIANERERFEELLRTRREEEEVIVARITERAMQRREGREIEELTEPIFLPSITSEVTDDEDFIIDDDIGEDIDDANADVEEKTLLSVLIATIKPLH